MAKSKKSDSKKAPKDKDLKALKADKPGKEKKTKKKEKAVKEPAAPTPAPAKKVLKPKKVAAPEVTFTTEEISLRAYFIAERRQAMGWPGDSANDWVEAEKQLRTEAKKKAK